MTKQAARRRLAQMRAKMSDTLWAIAAELSEDGDVRSMVDHIQRLNALDTAGLQIGQKLRVPVAPGQPSGD